MFIAFALLSKLEEDQIDLTYSPSQGGILAPLRCKVVLAEVGPSSEAINQMSWGTND
jgi:hypothetical protein